MNVARELSLAGCCLQRCTLECAALLISCHCRRYPFRTLTRTHIKEKDDRIEMSRVLGIVCRTEDYIRLDQRSSAHSYVIEPKTKKKGVCCQFQGVATLLNLKQGAG